MMAMMKCNECGRDVSDRASACPACGAPVSGDSTVHVRVTRTGAKWEGIGFVLIVAGMITMMAGDGLVSTLGTLALLAGFAVFIVGRFK